MATSMKIAVFWDAAEELTVCMIKVMMEAVSSSEILVNIYHTTQCNTPKDRYLQN
jgi:hypothetical protein